MDRAGLPPQRRVHPRAGDAFPGHAPRKGAPPRPRADRPRPGGRGDRARHPGDRTGLPNLRAEPLPRARSRAHPPPPHGVPGGAPAAPALARLRGRARGPAVAADRRGEGRRVRRARDRARPAAPSRSTAEPPARPGAISPSSFPSRWTRPAPCSSTPSPATTRRPRSVPGARRTADSGARSGAGACPRRSWPSPAPRANSSVPGA